MAAAAASASSATAHYTAAPNCIFRKKRGVPISVSFLLNRKLLLRVKNSSEESATTKTEEEMETPVEALPKGAPSSSSLISALNVDKALRGLAITEVDHYGKLGLQTGCSSDQVSNAYKSRVAQVMMNEQELDQEEVSKELELLKESHSILSSVQERRMYDWSLARSGKPDTYMWPYEFDNTPLSTQDPPPIMLPEDERPTTLTGYFFLAWLILSFTFLIAFSR